MFEKKIIGAGFLAVTLLLSGCGNTSQEETPAAPEEIVAEQEIEAVFDIQQVIEQEEISVELAQISMASNADFGEGRSGDALVVTLSVDNKNPAGPQLYPESGKMLLTTGEELLSAKSEYQETYSNGTVKKGDFYFPLQLTKLNEINGLTLVLEGSVNQYYEPIGEEYVFQVQVKHPSYEKVERSELIARAYAQSAELSQASGVSDTFHAGQQVEMGPVTIHLMDVMVYENIQHPYATFLNLEEPVHFVGVSLAVENQVDEVVYFSNARNKLLLETDITKDMDHLMSQYMGQVFQGGAIKTGTAFFQVEDEELASLSSIGLLLESPWQMEEDEKLVLSDDKQVDLGGLE